MSISKHKDSYTSKDNSKSEIKEVIKEGSLKAVKKHNSISAIFDDSAQNSLGGHTPSDSFDSSFQLTLSIIKPDAVSKRITGKINTCFESSGLRIVAQKMLHLSKEKASDFYKIHEKQPFFQDLVSFMSSGPVVVQVLYGADAVAKNRSIMGATNPKDAAAGTIRAMFADSIDENAVHGSDSLENAEKEIKFFFSQEEIFLQ